MVQNEIREMGGIMGKSYVKGVLIVFVVFLR
jgi:hypothetical protein